MADDLPIIPLWPRVGATESLDWLTDVMVTEDATEERTELRVAPRQSFKYTCFVPRPQLQLVSNIVYGARHQQLYVPAWPQVQRVGAVGAGLTELACETRYSEFRPGGRVLLWQAADKYQVLDMDAVASDTALTLIDETEAFDDAWLMPCRVGYMQGNPNRNFDGRSSVLDLTLAVEDNDELIPDAPLQYLGHDIYFDPGELDGGKLVETVDRKMDITDPGLGVVAYSSPWTFARVDRIHRIVMETPEEQWAARLWLHRRKGRSAAFWQPSFENDLRVNQTANVGAALTVFPDAYQTYASDRSHIAIETATGWVARRVLSATPLGPTQLQLVMDTTLGGISPSTIERVCFLGLKRLDTDHAEIIYGAGKNAALAVNTVEIQP